MYQVLDELSLTQVHLFGFDSFEGLSSSAQTEDGGQWAKTDLRYDLEATREYITVKSIDWRRVTLVKGWFDEVLAPDPARRRSLTKASLIMIDSDLYSSAREALASCAPFIQDDAIFFFDDWTEAG